MRPGLVRIWLFVVFVTLGLATSADPLPGWETDLDDGVRSASRSGKPVLVFFTAQWAPPGKAMKNETLGEEEVQRALRVVEKVEVDVDDQPQVAGEFGIAQLPTFVVLDSQGEEYDRFSGFLPEEGFVETLEAAIDPDLAIPELRERVERDPDDLKALWELARKYARDREPELTTEAIDGLRRADPSNAKGYLDNAGYLELMMTASAQNPAEAVRAARQFLEDFPNSEFADEVLFMQANLAYQMDEAETALEILGDFAERYPRSDLADEARRMALAIQREDR